MCLSVNMATKKIPNLLAWDRTGATAVKGEAGDNSEEENSKPAVICVQKLQV